MPRIIFMNDRLVPEDEARVSVFDHGLLYGDGVFEGLRSYSGRVFRLDAHIDRLWASARAICLEIPMTKEAVAKAVIDTLAANKLTDGYIRLVVTRGAGSLGLDPNRTKNPQVIVIADTISLYPAEFYSKGLKIVTAATQRVQSAALSPRIKSLNYLNNIMAKMEAQQHGFHECLMLNEQGYVSECTGDNVFLIHKGEAVGRDQLAAFRWAGGGPYPAGVTFVKCVKGLPGDLISREGRRYAINGWPVGEAKTHSRQGLPLEPGPVGRLPPGRYYVQAPHPDSLDSRYALTGWIHESQILGRAHVLF